MRPVHPRLHTLALLALAPCASAQTVGYASGFDVDTGTDSLYRITLETAQATRIGPIGFLDVEGLAVHPDGSLYGAADGSNQRGGVSDVLIRIDPNTGAGNFVAPFADLAGQGPGLGGQLDYGLAASCDGRLWLSSDTLGHIWEVNRQDGSLRVVLQNGPPLSGLSSRGPYLYGVSVGATAILYRLDTRNGQMASLGSLGLDSPIYDAGLDFDADGRLWATLDYLTPPEGAPIVLRNELAELDPSTGRVLRRLTISGAGSGINTVQMEGFAISSPSCTGGGVIPPPAQSPVPVPAQGPLALLLASLALALAGLLRLRRS